MKISSESWARVKNLSGLFSLTVRKIAGTQYSLSDMSQLALSISLTFFTFFSLLWRFQIIIISPSYHQKFCVCIFVNYSRRAIYASTENKKIVWEHNFLYFFMGQYGHGGKGIKRAIKSKIMIHFLFFAF
jgi:hypothetical protein